VAKSIAGLILSLLFAVFSGNSYSSTHPEIKIVLRAVGTTEQVSRITKLTEVTRKVINHPEFEKRVRSAWTKYDKAFSYSDDSGDQVFQKIVDGAEIGGNKDNVWQLSYVFQPQKRACFGIGRFKTCSSWVYGWTNSKTEKVYINSLPWDGRESCGIVGTQVHEQLHKLKYEHPFNDTATRYLSVPYAVGTIAAEICKKYFI
jgi:hypothetical protein